MAVAPAPAIRRIGPQPGLQTALLSTPADVAIGGGAAGAGKTFSILLEPTRHIHRPGFGAVVFRREGPMITNQGGLWDESQSLYPGLGAKPNLNDLSWTFPPVKTRVRFSHMQLVKDRFSWDGAQIPLIEWDQLESFFDMQFWYMMSRNRSTCGVRPYVRATCNPVPEDDQTGGWLCKLISWWIDPDTGYPIVERGGKIRWFIRLNETLHWGDSREELIQRFSHEVPPSELLPKSFTFIPGTLADNPILTKADPGYKGWLMSLPLVERERLLGGNWKIKPTAGKVFNRTWFKSTLHAFPTDVTNLCRYFDKAGTEDGGKYTAGALMGRRKCGRFVLANIVRGQWSANGRETVIKQTADADAILAKQLGVPYEIWVEQEPGSGGKESAENTTMNLAGHTVKVERVTGSKLARCGPYSAQVEAGNVDLMADLGASVNGVTAFEAYLNEAQNFDGVNGYSDQIDASGGAFNKLALPRVRAGVW